MKFGTFVTSLKPDSITRNIRKAEELGFESAWIGEHLIIPVKSESKYPYSADGSFPAPINVPFHDPMLALTYAAAVTSKIKLATGVFVVPLRNAIATAKAVASLDVLSNGRVIFGIGVGWWAEEFAITGASFKDRALKTREYIELMKELWTKDEPSYHGKTISVEGVRFYPKPIQKPYPPIVVGGTSDLAIKRTVRYGDGWYAVARSFDETRSLIAKLREAEKDAHRTKLVGSPLGAGAEKELERVRDEIMTKL